jgi:hypothetical protein
VTDAFDTVITFFKKLLKGDVKGAFKAVFDFFRNTFATLWEKAFKPFLEFMETIFVVLWENALKPLFEFFETVFVTIWEKAIKPFFDFMETVFVTIWEKAVKPFFDFMETIFVSLWENVLKPIVDFFETTFVSIWDNVLKPVVDFFEQVFVGIWELALEPIASFFGDIGTTIWNGVKAAFELGADFLKGVGGWIWDGLKGALDGVIDVFKNLGTWIWDGLKAAFDGVGTFFSDIGGKIWNGLKAGLDGIGGLLEGIFAAINPANLFDKLFDLGDNVWGTGSVEDIIGKVFSGFDIPFIKFAEGGAVTDSMVPGTKVPGIAQTPGDNKANDRVPALLSPGEHVLSREEVKAFEKMFDGPVLKLFGGTLGKIGGAISSGFKSVVDGGKKLLSGEAGGVLGSLSRGEFSEAFAQLDPTNALRAMKDNLLDPIKDRIHHFFENMIKSNASGSVSNTSHPVQFGGSVPIPPIGTLAIPGPESFDNMPPIILPEESELESVTSTVVPDNSTTFTPEQIMAASATGAVLIPGLSGMANGGFVDVPNGVVRNAVLNAQGGAFARNSGGQGTDTIRANLTPGEFVVNREATRENLGLLSFINESRRAVQPGAGDTTMNVSVVINAKTNLTPDMIKREVVPTLEKELRRKSQQGHFVLSTAGLRS